MQSTIRRACRIGFFSWAILIFCVTLRAEALSPELDYFPSRLHAAIFRNWEIVPHERLASVLQTDVATIRKAGKEMGLITPKAPTPEELRRNVEIVLRRNWALLPRPQIEALLGFTPHDFDEFLGKEIFLRALLASPPAELTPLKYEVPSNEIISRTKWFRDHVTQHLKTVASTPEEPRLAYISELRRAHKPGDYIPGTKPKQEEADLREGWLIEMPNSTNEFLKNAANDFAEYCRDIQHTGKMPVRDQSNPGTHVPKKNSILLTFSRETVPSKPESYILQVSHEGISIRSASEVGLARGLVELERRMTERGGPFLSPCHETNSPSFSPRFVSSYFSLMTDVLGQDLLDPFPDGYLNELFHQDADGVWVYALLQDLVPSPVFEGMGVGSEKRLEKLRSIVERAAKRGLKVYIYLNEPRAQTLSFFDKYPDVKGQVEGNTAALCTSTEAVQKHLRGSFEKLFREVPGLGGVFVITASENLANCYSHGYGNKTSCPRCSKRSSADVIAESIRCMSDGVWAANPAAKFIVWDWSWHSVLGEETPEKIIKQLPKGVALMADFERGTRIERGGIPMNVEEYSISVPGPSPRAKIRSEQAKQFGYEYFAKIQLSTTWECGTVPFIPVPNLLARKAQAMQSVGTTGAMATWTIGSYPSPNTEAFALQNWHSHFSETEVLRRIALKRYGPEAVEDAVRGWTKLSNALAEEFPFFGSYAPPLQHGPSLAWYRHDIPPPYGNATLFNCKDDWRHWTAPFAQDVMAKLLFHLCDRWEEGLNDLRAAAKKASGPRRALAEQDLGVAWMVAYHYRAYANALHFYGARDGGDMAEMKRRASAEIKQTEEAFRLVRADSRLGWEAELQYFYRPADVLERLISLDAVMDPPEATTKP